MNMKILIVSLCLFMVGVSVSNAHNFGLYEDVTWRNGSELKVACLNGTVDECRDVIHIASEWSNFGNIKFKRWTVSGAQILIEFIEPGDQSKPYLGATLGLGVEMLNTLPNPNMYLRHPRHFKLREFRRVVLHEFGHALGVSHEHLREDAPFEWDRETVIDYFVNVENWTLRDVLHNFFNEDENGRREGGIKVGGYDTKSIMHYGILPEWTQDNTYIPTAFDLSPGDKATIGTMYPFKDGKTSTTMVEGRLEGERFVALRSRESLSGDTVLGWSEQGSITSLVQNRGGESKAIVSSWRPPVQEQQGTYTASTGDGVRGWDWDGSTISMAIYDPQKRITEILYYKFKQGVWESPYFRKAFLAHGDIVRGWSRYGTKASVVLWDKKNKRSVLFEGDLKADGSISLPPVGDGDGGVNFLGMQVVSREDNIRGWSTDGEDAYLVRF